MNIKPTVAHSVTYFLFLTGSWIYNWLINAKKIRPVVLTNNRENEAIFPFNKVYCEKNLGRIGSRMISFLTNRLSLDFNPFKSVVLKYEGANLLHSHFGNRGYSDLTLANKLKVPHIVTFYGYDAWRLPEIDPSWKTRFTKLFEHGELFLAEGPFMLRRLIELGCPEEKARVLKIGVDLNAIEFVPRKIGKDGLIKILIAGTFTEKKGIPYALEAIGKLRERHSNIRVALIGDSSPKIADSFEEKNRIFNTINKYHMESMVSIMGYQPPSVLSSESKKCHILIAPSVHAKDGDSEGGSPVIITEMSAAGMPILSTTHCDIPGVVIDGKTGFLAKEKNVDELVMKLDYLLKNPGLWVEMGEAGRRHVEKEFNLLVQVNKLEDMYLEFI